jgi:hopanoid biosynthesis associated protein HpnK
MNLSFVYPIYNEIENLPRLLPETARIAAGVADDYEVVLVDDGSTDGSGDMIDRLAASNSNVRALHHGRNRGLGAAIRTGLVSATKDLVLYMDSDFPVDAEEARAALLEFTDATDLLIGYRLGRAEGPRREIMSWTYNRLIRWTSGVRVRDVNFAFKLIRRRLLEQMHLRSEGSFIDAELLLEAARLGARLREVGLQYHTRTAGVSTAASYTVVLRIFGEMARYWRRRRAGLVGPARLVVNADDFGLCPEINAGVAASFDRGIVSSASLLPSGDSFDEAVELARARPALDLGIHLALTQTRPQAPAHEIASLVDGSGRFPANWRTFAVRYLRRGLRPAEVERELRAQIEKALSTGLSFSHLDSHQHVHMLPSVLPIAARLANEYRLGAVRYPCQRRTVQSSRAGHSLRRRAELSLLRGLCRLGRGALHGNGLVTPDDFRGFAEAGRWCPERLIDTIRDLDPGLTEIGCHPGADDGVDAQLGWGYGWEGELAALTSPEVLTALDHSGVKLTTYRELLGRSD